MKFHLHKFLKRICDVLQELSVKSSPTFFNFGQLFQRHLLTVEDLGLPESLEIQDCLFRRIPQIFQNKHYWPTVFSCRTFF